MAFEPIRSKWIAVRGPLAVRQQRVERARAKPVRISGNWPSGRPRRPALMPQPQVVRCRADCLVLPLHTLSPRPPPASALPPPCPHPRPPPPSQQRAVLGLRRFADLRAHLLTAARPAPREPPPSRADVPRRRRGRPAEGVRRAAGGRASALRALRPLSSTGLRLGASARSALQGALS